MTVAIVLNRPRLLHRLAHLLEGSFADVAECVDAGGGVYETRAEYRRKFLRCGLMWHPDGVRGALILNAAAQTKYTAWRTLTAAKITAGTASQDEIDWYALPAATTLDATWTAGPPP